MARWLPIASLLVAIAAAPPAGADAIDGDWCHKDGRRVFIDRPTIVTPGGKRMEGDYRRHQFYYTVPGGERDAGSKVAMEQLDDDTVHVITGAGPETTVKGPVQTWHQCRYQPMT